MKKQGIIITVLLAIIAIVVAVYLLTKNKVTTVASSLSALTSTSTLGDVVSELKKSTIRTVGTPLKKIRTTLKTTDTALVSTIPAGKNLVEIVWKSGTGKVEYDTEIVILNESNPKYKASSSINEQTNIINPTGDVIVTADINSEFRIAVTEL